MSHQQGRNLSDPQLRAPNADTLVGMAIAKFLSDWHRAHPDLAKQFVAWRKGWLVLPPLFSKRWKPSRWLYQRDALEAALLALTQPEPPTTEPESEPLVIVVKHAPMVLSLELAMAWRDTATAQTRELAGRFVALYENRYSWQTGAVTPRREVKAAA